MTKTCDHFVGNADGSTDCEHERGHDGPHSFEPPGKEPPLLLCVDCKNTESPAGAMARQWNHGRCAHCGGFFKVIRA